MPTVHRRHGQTDGRTTYDSNTALSLRASRGKKSTTAAAQSKKLWCTFKSILGRDQSGSLPKNHLPAQQFLDVLSEKVEAVRLSTAGGTVQSMLSQADVSFDTFVRGTIDDVKRTITSAPSKSCALDPLPTTFMKDFLPETFTVSDRSVQLVTHPISQRHAIILPRSKKVGDDSADVKNYQLDFHVKSS